MIPHAQRIMVLGYKDRSTLFNDFCVKYPLATVAKTMSRAASLWDGRKKIAAKEAESHIMIPAKIVNKCVSKVDSSPDVGELLVNTNNLLAQLVQLQKEQSALFEALRPDKKS